MKEPKNILTSNWYFDLISEILTSDPRSWPQTWYLNEIQSKKNENQETFNYDMVLEFRTLWGKK